MSGGARATRRTLLGALASLAGWLAVAKPSPRGKGATLADRRAALRSGGDEEGLTLRPPRFSVSRRG